jgi:hypothetical protein
MNEHQNPNPQDSESGKASALNQARETYQSVDDFLSVRDDDSTLVMIGKVLLRILGIIILILLSPFIFVGLFIAFLAAL